MAFGELTDMRDSWESIITKARAISGIWKITPKFSVVRNRRTRNSLMNLIVRASSRSRSSFQESSTVFFVIVDISIAQLKSRFEGQRFVSAAFSFLYPKSLLHLSNGYCH